MEVILADKYGFCFGVKRAIKITEKIAQNNPNTLTLGPLIHNPLEISRLEKNFGVKVQEDITKLGDSKSVIIRTHGITKQNLEILQTKGVSITDATCPFVTKPQQIVEKMSNDGYNIVIFGDSNHPEVRSVMSYSVKTPIVVSDLESLQQIKKNSKKSSSRITNHKANRGNSYKLCSILSATQWKCECLTQYAMRLLRIKRQQGRLVKRLIL